MNGKADLDLAPSDCRTRSKIWLTTLIVLQLVLYTMLTLLSSEFRFGSLGADRPLLVVLGILTAAFVASLASIPLALRLSDSTGSVVVLFLVALAFRLIVLASEPIQEVDLYRYLWDGAVSGEGVSPYRFAPAEILEAVDASVDHQRTSEEAGSEFERLVDLARRSEGLEETLRRVHYNEVPTVYPPVSQVVFRFCNWITPSNAGTSLRVLNMKLVIVCFDLGVMVMLLVLLRSLSINPGWCIAYGWSPLIIKEFANSGHLDSIAVFLCMAAIVAVTMACQANPRFKSAWIIGSGALLSLGIGAKLYPIVIAPLFFCFIGKRWGVRFAMTWAVVTMFVTVGVFAPMLAGRAGGPSVAAIDDGPERFGGLKTFLSRWEINDLLFMVVEENIRPEQTVAGQPHLWFAVTPDRSRVWLTSSASSLFGGDIERTPFLLTRLLTSAAFVAFVLILCRRVWVDPDQLYSSAFLAIAWFWFLSPTQNPWYWSWALPLIPWARSRLWLLVSGLSLTYYTRFWFDYHAPATSDWGLPYEGVEIFDFIVVWFEFAPFLMALFIAALIARRSGQPA